jgi:hypothetical protein
MRWPHEQREHEPRPPMVARANNRGRCPEQNKEGKPCGMTPGADCGGRSPSHRRRRRAWDRGSASPGSGCRRDGRSATSPPGPASSPALRGSPACGAASPPRATPGAAARRSPGAPGCDTSRSGRRRSPRPAPTGRAEVGWPAFHQRDSQAARGAVPYSACRRGAPPSPDPAGGPRPSTQARSVALPRPARGGGW